MNTNLTKKQAFIVAEDRFDEKKVVKFNDDGTITWEDAATLATKFYNYGDAIKNIEEYFGEDDFGIGLFKVAVSSKGKKSENWTYLTDGMIDRDIIIPKVSSITNDYIDSVLLEEDEDELIISEKDETDPLKFSDEFIYENRLKVKRAIFKKINKLIDLHDTLDIPFATTASTSLERKKENGVRCQSCLICDRVDAYVKLLDNPVMSKFYEYLMGSEHNRFNDFKGKGKKAEDNLDALAYLMRDFVALRKNEFTLIQIARMYGIGNSLLYRYYDMLADSEYCYVIGRKRRTSKNDYGYKRNGIDTYF